MQRSGNGLRRVGLILLIVGGISALGAAIDPAPNAQHDPPGNNGTVKVDDDPAWDRPNPPNDNDPHVDCEFEVAFYNFDKGDYKATVTFEFQEPTRRPGKDVDQTIVQDEVFIGEDPAGGGQDEDSRQTYDLEGKLGGVEPQENQGFHVKLTVNAPGSQGNDVKHKVFWIDCGTPPSTTTTVAPTTTTTPSSTTTVAPTTTTTPSSTTTVAPTSATTAVGAVVEAGVEEPPTTTTTVQVGGEELERAIPLLPRTGARRGTLFAGMGLMFAGLVCLAVSRRR